MNSVHPSLELLLTGYFHQDWELDASSPAEVIEHFARREPPAAVDAAIASIDQILRRRDSEMLAEAILRDLYCQIDPKGFGLSARAWLQDLRVHLQRYRTRSKNGGDP